MKYKAVIFDLFGTLVYNLSHQELENYLAEIAEIIMIPYDDFARHWFESFDKRATGEFSTTQATLEYMCRTFNVSAPKDRIERASRIILDYTIGAMKPVPGSVEVLTRLKSKNYKTGLISDCSAGIPVAWENSPFALLFDVTVFSCIAGMKKPDPRIYHMALDELGVQPEYCMYIGDGGSHELIGARGVGMYPVFIRQPDESIDAHIVNREDWDEPEISSLWEVCELLEIGG